MNNSYDYFGWLFRITVPEDYFGCLFQVTIPGYCSGWLFRMPISDAYFRWLFQVTVPNDYFGCLRMTVSNYCSRWIFRMLVSDDLFHNSTTDSYFSNQSVFPWSIPISTNHSTDWSHDWFVFERRLPTAELWPRSPLIGKFNSNYFNWWFE